MWWMLCPPWIGQAHRRHKPFHQGELECFYWNFLILQEDQGFTLFVTHSFYDEILASQSIDDIPKLLSDGAVLD